MWYFIIITFAPILTIGLSILLAIGNDGHPTRNEIIGTKKGRVFMRELKRMPENKKSEFINKLRKTRN